MEGVEEMVPLAEQRRQTASRVASDWALMQTQSQQVQRICFYSNIYRRSSGFKDRTTATEHLGLLNKNLTRLVANPPKMEGDDPRTLAISLSVLRQFDKEHS